MEFNYIDVHSHLNLDQFESDRAQVINQMNEKGIATITVGVDFESSKLAIELAEKYDNLYACVGLHPADLPTGQAGNVNEIFNIEEYKKIAEHKKVVAIGETGLDYYRLVNSEQVTVDSEERIKTEKERQKEIFKKHIELALQIKKPLMVHARPSKGTQDAYNDVLDILENCTLSTVNYKLVANFHFFVGDVSIAKRIVETGHTVSFDGPITFTDEYNEVIKYLPLENIMAETDAPFAAPVPYRGKRCQPDYVVEIYKKIAEIKGLDPEMVRQQINQNAKRVFGVM